MPKAYCPNAWTWRESRPFAEATSIRRPIVGSAAVSATNPLKPRPHSVKGVALPKDRSGRCAIAVMGKAPRIGRAKTRLAVTVGAEAAAALGAAFLRDTTANVVLAGRDAPIRSVVAYAPAGSEPLLEPLLAPGTSLLLADGHGIATPGVAGFGCSLLQAIERLLDAGNAAACVLNADGPTLPTRHLVRAAQLLARPGDRAVLGIARDGGYYLLGLKRPHAALFRDIPWSTAAVAAATQARADAIGLEIATLPDWFDVDDGPSLDHLIASLRANDDGGFAAPATRAALAQFGLLATESCEA